jgi:tetratricopeptide (TPR) repeat protein
VARLDGPSAAIARALVDKALEAESNGLWGRAYFDLRGLTNGEYKKGDDWIRAAADITHDFGFETVVDDNPQPFPAAFPMSQIALYAGWYAGNVWGPFARPKVEFMPGAFAYHLHSFSAQTLRSTTEHWCGPLLAAGATATMGCIDEPYLDGTPNMDVFFACWLQGALTFGEAAYACQRVLSWQTTVIGDPLYRPFGKSPKERHDALEQRHSKLLAWSDLQMVDKGLVLGATPGEMAQYLLNPGVPQDSAVLAEKLAELDYKQGLFESSIKALRRALQFDPTPQQRVRLTLTLSERLAAAGRQGEALALCEDFLKQSPDYPDALGLYTKMEEMATKLHQTRQAQEYAREIIKLTTGK